VTNWYDVLSHIAAVLRVDCRHCVCELLWIFVLSHLGWMY